MFEQIFEPMHTILPEGAKGTAKVVHYEVDDETAKWSSLRAAVKRDANESVRAGKYVRLEIGGTLFMSDTQMERRTNYQFVARANGDVLIAGLGIGLVLVPLLKNERVKSVTVIENNQDVIDLVAPHFQNEKLTIIRADIFNWKPKRKFDCIYFDIWEDICTDNLEEINKLHRRFKSYRNRENPDSFMSSWQVENLRYQKQREKNCYW